MLAEKNYLHISTKTQELILNNLILASICITAVFIRFFSITEYEVIIHEYDPWFNFRSTQLLALPPLGKSIIDSIYNFYEWFDIYSWYPLGRLVGQTIFPGLMFTSSVIYWIFRALDLEVSIQEICVLIPAFFACLTCLSCYWLTLQTVGRKSTALLAAFLAGIIPGYMSRSIAGSYDNECISIFILVFTLTLWVYALNNGSTLWATACALSFFYMASSWGGYIFIINLIPLHTFILILFGRYSQRLYTAYSTFYVLGTILSMQVRFISIKPIISPDHLPSLGVFGFLQIYAFVVYLKFVLNHETFQKAVRLIIFSCALIFCALLVTLYVTGSASLIGDRFYTFFNPSHARENKPIVASVSEHQASTWSSYFIDLHYLTVFTLVGLYYLFQNITETKIFVTLYTLVCVYLSANMVRVILILSPIVCVVASIGISGILRTHISRLITSDSSVTQSKKKAKHYPVRRQKIVHVMSVGLVLLCMFLFIRHSISITAYGYSSPSLILKMRPMSYSNMYLDDYREAYTWLRFNTPQNARIMSWWDYGYQISGMGNRTVIIDNSTWNNTHIAEVALAMVSPEEEAIKIARKLDADYVLVVFGGAVGYSSDDISKYLWMVKISASVHKHVIEDEYYAYNRQNLVGSKAPVKLRNSLAYKLCYYRYSNKLTNKKGMDHVRKAIIDEDIELKYFEEAYTTKNWVIRIYKVKSEENLGEPDL
ncbi:dolichyl-diphosphooligosaccharide--protein glycosyltransferase subunit STT3A-like [Schistocerca gregaria]|uniref:dolichyl-diphosphooligosaccharide--protein glycosyltransferase subunit STT3A-like n=1 Tax=Schistocerca gregaria TaxID=7010 RepID=UPI00211EF8B1|nr:dolichyl-diphosphooligosaccharide--protein glycosyltransferase subunit STT3A-like [Schistocerca gregaria]